MINSQEEWMHGTEVYFTEWKLPLEKLNHKNGMEPHSALFFTTSKDYVQDVAGTNGGYCTVKIQPTANILDMNNCTREVSEAYRKKVQEKKTAGKNAQVINYDNWNIAWKTGSIMKYMPSDYNESKVLNIKLILARNFRNTLEGAKAFNELQILTRENIEDIVVSARELGYDCVIGNEIDTLSPDGPKTFKIMFVLNEKSITSPFWVVVPDKKEHSINSEKRTIETIIDGDSIAKFGEKEKRPNRPAVKSNKRSKMAKESRRKNRKK